MTLHGSSKSSSKLNSELGDSAFDTNPPLNLRQQQRNHELIEDLYDDVFGSRNSNVSITSLDKPMHYYLLVAKKKGRRS